jgi:hypothetical protein
MRRGRQTVDIKLEEEEEEVEEVEEEAPPYKKKRTPRSGGEGGPLVALHIEPKDISISFYRLVSF